MVEANRALALAKVHRIAEARAGVERAAEAPGVWIDRFVDQAWIRILANEGKRDDAATRADELEEAAAHMPYPFGRTDVLIETAVVARMIGDDAAAERRATTALAVASAKGSIAQQLKAAAVLADDLSRL